LRKNDNNVAKRKKRIFLPMALLAIPMILLLLLSQTAFAQNTYVINDGDRVMVYTSAATDPAAVLDELGLLLGEDDTYTFAAGEDLAETVEIIIAFKGDANLDAVVDLDDIDVLDQWLYPKRDPDHVDLTDLQFLILDMDQSEDVDLDDSDVLDQYMYPKRDPDHAEIPWDN